MNVDDDNEKNSDSIINTNTNPETQNYQIFRTTE